MMSPEFDTDVRLEDARGVQFAEADDGGEGRHSRLAFTSPNTGDHRVVATTFRGGGGGGIYHLHVEQVSGVRTDGALQLVNGSATVTARLSGQDGFDPVRNDTYRRVFPLSLEAGKIYDIALTSPDFAPYLRIEDASGRQLALAAEGAPSRHADLAFVAPTSAVFRIVATTVGGRASDTFTLTVRETSRRP